MKFFSCSSYKMDEAKLVMPRDKGQSPMLKNDYASGILVNREKGAEAKVRNSPGADGRMTFRLQRIPSRGD